MKTKVRIDFCDFWPGFVKTENFFYIALSKRFDVKICDRPDFLIYADTGNQVHRVYNCPKIYFTVESFPPDFTKCDYAFTHHYLDDPRHLRLPFYVVTTPANRVVKTSEELAGSTPAKTKFCSFVVTNAGKQKVRKRIDFFQRLSKYKKVDSAGRALNNIGRELPPGQAAKIDFIRPYKFTIAFENQSIPGYTTEKITDAMWARTMPIYWGNPRIGEEFNGKSFLNFFDFPSEEALIEKIIELDKDDAKYAEYARQPYFHHNEPNEFFSEERLLNQFEKIFSAKITPVSRRRKWFQIGRWIPVKKNPPNPA